MSNITPFLWFDNQAEEAARFYTSVFQNSRITSTSPMMVTFELEGKPFMALNGGPQFKFNEAISFFISCQTQQEVDSYWTRLTADGGSESQCGWLKDKYGLSWQVVPEALGRYLGDPDQGKSQRVLQAMLKMNKIVIADLDGAYAG